MSLELISAEFDAESGEFLFKGKFHEEYDEIHLYVEKNVKFTNINPHIACNVNINEYNEFKITFNVNRFTEKGFFNNTVTWSCFFLCDGEKIPVVTENSFNSYEFPNNKLFTVTPVQKDTLTFIINFKPITVQIDTLEFSEDHISIGIKTDYLQGLPGETPSLSLKCREKKAFFKYYKSIDIPLASSSSSDTDYHLKESLSIFSPYLDNYEFFDVFFEIKNHLGKISIPLESQTPINSSFTLVDPAHKIKPVVTENNQISLFFTLNLILEVSKMDISGGKINLDGAIEMGGDDESLPRKFNYTGPGEFVIKKCSSLFKEPEYYQETACPVELRDGCLDTSIAIRDFIPILESDEIYDLFIRLKVNGRYIDVPLKTEEDIKPNTVYNDLFIELRLNESGIYSLYSYTASVQHDIVKIGVLGTCFSRTAFNSLEYFNQDYKKFYKVTFSQLYHTAIPALTSKPLDDDIRESICKNLDKSPLVVHHNREFVIADLNKSFFQDLKNADIDYLVIDLYADAVKDLAVFPDGSCLSTFRLNLNELCPDLEFDLISPHDNDDVYFETFKQGLDKFADEILQIIPAERIILNMGNFAYKWKNEKGDIVYYGDYRIALNEDINYFWDKINNYFKTKIPDIRVIDLTNTSYIPHDDFPFGVGPMHYEPEYYKEFLNRLNKIVFEDKLKELTLLHEQSYGAECDQKTKLERDLMNVKMEMAERSTTMGYLRYKIRNLIERLNDKI